MFCVLRDPPLLLRRWERAPEVAAGLSPSPATTLPASACVHSQLGHRVGSQHFFLWCGKLGRSVVPFRGAEWGSKRGLRSDFLSSLKPIHLPLWAPELKAMLFKEWLNNQQHQNYLGVVRNADSGVLLQTH